MVGTLSVAGPGRILSWAALDERSRSDVAPGSPEAVIARAVRGDRDAFGLLVEENKRSVHALCVRLLADPEEARDAAQEAFARAFASLEGFDPAQSFTPWVLRIARNHCLDLLRRRLPARARLELDAEDDEGARRELADPSVVAADEAMERAQVRVTLEAAVASLPPNYREVVHLFHVEQMSYKEISATLGVPMGTVMTWLHRARSRLRDALGGKDLQP